MSRVEAAPGMDRLPTARPAAPAQPQVCIALVPEVEPIVAPPSAARPCVVL